VGIERFVDEAYEQKISQVTAEFQQLYAERMGQNRDLGGGDDEDGASGYGPAP